MGAPAILLPLNRVTQVPQGRLMRRVPLCPIWSVDGWMLNRDIDRLLKRDLWIADLDSTLDLPGSAIWRRLLDHPRVRAHLRSLRFHSNGACGFSTDIARIIGSMPHLQRLALKIEQFWISPDHITLLMRAPQLTALQIEHALRAADLPALLETPRTLRHLGLTWPAVSAAAAPSSNKAPTPHFRSFFTSDALLHLTSLFLCDIAGSSSECACASHSDLIAVFSALSQLQRFHIRSSTGASALLPHLLHARALHAATVESSNTAETASMGVWSMLFAARPELRGVALLVRGEEYALYASQWMPTWAHEYSASQPAYLHALTIRVTDAECRSNRPSAVC